MSADVSELINSAELPRWLEHRLGQPLSGPMMDSKYAPRPRLGRDYGRIPADARPSAVLLLLYWHQEAWFLPLTLRPTSLPDHGGQVSLPGGAIEPGETSFQAAIREFHEELGAPECSPRILGQLTPIYIERSRFRVDPWLGVVEERPQFCPQSAEVAELLEIPLVHLLHPANFASHWREYRGQAYQAPHFVFQQYRIWGATCLILGEFVTLLQEYLGEKRTPSDVP